MRTWLEGEWQRLGGGALVLFPLAVIFAAGVAVRRALYRLGWLRAWRAPVPVVVVGNITAGGAGKTPLVIALVELLRAEGRRPGVVSRGYGRVPSTDADPLGVIRVLPGVATPEHFGDEPVLIARRTGVPVYVSPDRPAAVRAMLEAHPETDVVITDDGLQHYALARDVEIVVVDGERGFGNRLPLPAGPLREPVSRLREVDCVVVNGGGDLPLPAVNTFSMRLGRELFVSFSGDEMAPADFAAAARGRRVAAVAGIANPSRFFSHLDRLGVVAERHAFPDHHPFQPDDLRLPGAEAIVMTEKDAVKCVALSDPRMWFLRVDAALPADFRDFLLRRITERTRH